MIEVFKRLKGIPPPTMTEIFRLGNIKYTINPWDLDNQLPKIVYCGLETIACKGPQLVIIIIIQSLFNVGYIITHTDKFT